MKNRTPSTQPHAPSVARRWIFSAFLLLATLSTAPAAVVVNLLEQSGDVVATGSGSLNTAGLSLYQNGGTGSILIPSNGGVTLGSFSLISTFAPIAGPVNFGGGGSNRNVASESGNLFGVLGGGEQLIVPYGYTSGTSLSATATWANSTFTSLGLTTGTYEWTWGGGDTADSFTLNIGPIALPATHWLGQTGSNWSDANWASDASGAATTATPTSSSTVTFSATGAGNQSATVLTADTTIGGLIVADSKPVGISGGKTLTISSYLQVRSSANLTVSGKGTVISAGTDVTVANNPGDNATLNISGGAEVTGTNAYVASATNTTGTLNVDGPGSMLTLTNSLVVDQGGNGTLNITNGGVVSNKDGHLAQQPDELATVTVDGTGSQWNNTGTLTVGEQGAATLTIKNGGSVSVGGGSGTLTLGAQSRSSGALNIGAFGGNSTAGTLSAAEVTGGTGTAVVNFNQTDDITFAPKITGSASVNQLGTGTTTLTGTNTYTGATTVSAGTLYNNGDNSAATGDVFVLGGTLGGSGKLGSSVSVHSGGTITAGADATSTGTLSNISVLYLLDGSTALFKLAGTNSYDQIGAVAIETRSNVTLSLQLTDGYTGAAGDTFKIFDIVFGGPAPANFSLNSNLDSKFKWDLSGLALAGEVAIALSIPSATHWLGQTGVNWSEANWASNAAGTPTTATPTSADDITFSATGAANQLHTVLDADTTIKSLTVESSAGIQGSKTLTITGDTNVNAGTLTLSGGVTVLTGGKGTIDGAGAGAVVTVDGKGTTWSVTGDLIVGNNATGTLNVTGGSVSSDTLYVGKTNGGTNLTVSDGGALTNGKTVIGFDAASDNNTVLITGAKTEWNSSVTFHLGYNGSGNQMTVSDGAAVSVSAPGGQNVDALIGFNDGANSNILTVTGKDSSFTNNATLYVGRSGTGNELEILQGGLVTSHNVRIGGGTGSNGQTADNFAIVDGAGSTWNISGTMRVGSSGNFSRLTISNGGAVNVTGNTFVGYDATSNGNSVLVWDKGSKWSLNALSIGHLGTNSVVTVAFESSLTASSIVVGEQAGSSGTLQIAEKGTVSIGSGEGTLHLAQAANSTGTLDIGVANIRNSNIITPNIIVSKFTTAGTLDAAEVNGGPGTATINFYQTDDPYVFLPKITGSTSVNQSGPGTTVIQTANTYTGGTTVRNGVLQTINASALGTGPVTINHGILGVAGPLGGISTLKWNGGNIALSPGQGDVITTTGAFTNGGGGGAFLIGTAGLKQQTYTLVNFDSTNFLLGDFSALSSNPGLTYQYSFALNQNNVQITMLGATANGNQLHNIENGVPTFGDFTASGNVVSGLAPDGAREPNTIVATLGTTPGTSLDIPDWNTLNITGNQPTIIVGGSSLNLDGTLNAKQVIIDALAQMTGHGLLNGDLLNNGTVAPGNSPGTLTVAGNFTQTSTGTLQIQIASPAVFDQLIVGGTASLAGTLQVQSYGGYQVQYGQQFAFLHAGSITGAFDSITTSDPSVFRARFLVNGGTGTILIAPASYTLVAQTQNQRNVAKALDGFITATTGDRQAVSLALDLQNKNQYPAAFNAIAPTFYESLANITIEQTATRAQMLAQRSSAVRLGARGFQSIGIEAPLKYDKDGRNVMDAKDGKNIMSPADDNNWGVWVQGNGIFARATSVNQTPSYNFQNGGFLAGADYQWSENFVTGVYAGYQGTYAKYSNGGVTTINAVDFGLYAGYHSGGFYTDAIVGGGSGSYEVNRPIKFSTVNRTATSKPYGGQFTTYLGFGYDWNVGNFTFGPILSGQYTYAGIAPFTETGAGALDLAVRQQNVNSLRTSLGGRVAYTWKLTDTISLIPEGRLFWQHEFLENSRNIASSLDGGNGPSFDYATSAPSRDAVFAAAGVSAQFGPNWTAYLYYNADFGRQDYVGHSVSTGLNFKF